MYTDFYGLKEEPFNITPDPRFLYWSPKHQEAFRHLVYSVQSNKGLAVLTGEPGTGKTAILHAVTEHLNVLYPGVHIAFLINSNIGVHDLFRLIFDEFCIEHSADSKGMYLIHLKRFLVDSHRRNEKCVLVLDEAQNFHASILEEIRLLSNMETAVEKLLHIFLVGQPQLLNKIKTLPLAQLKQRLGIMHSLLPLNRQEVELYIHKRLSVAGAHEVEIFTPDALDEIFVQAKGLPRLINIICDNALLFGCAANTYHITRDIIRQVAHDMDLNTWQENDALSSAVPTGFSGRGLPPQAIVSATSASAEQHEGQASVVPERQETRGEETDRFIILQNTALAERKYWDNLFGKASSKENDLVRIWQEAAEREARQRSRRLLSLGVLGCALLAALGGEHFGLWSLRAAAGRVWETVSQPSPLGESDAKAQASNAATSAPPVSPRTATTEEGGEPHTASRAVPSIATLPAPPQPSNQPSTSIPVQQTDGEKVKKVVVVRAGDTFSRILRQEYGEYSQAVVALVTKANPGLGNIHILDVGQRLNLPERPE